jgi:ATP-dependent helicase HrpA
VMTPADVMQAGASEPEAVKFPDAQIFETLRLPLSYKLDQAAADDGITATIRLGEVHELDGRSFEWLVPGRLAEKLASLVKTLPKNVRTSLGAAKQVGDAAANALAFGEGDLFEQFAAYVRKTTALSVQPGDFRPDQVEPHLRMNFRVLDEGGRVVAEGRDLAAIQLELRKRVAEAIRRLPAGPFNRSGITAWDFGDLPEHLDARANGQAVRVYPALTDEKGVVAIRPFDDPARAAEGMRGGLTRLLMLQVRPQIRSLVTTMPGIERLTLLHATVGPGELLIEDLSELTAWRAFFADGTGVRTKAQFERRLDDGWAKLGAAGREAFDLAERVFTARQAAAARLAGMPAGWHAAGGAAIAADVKLQLALLVPRRALALTPWRWLQQIPRYLAAVNRRLEKAVGEGLERDARNMAEVTRFMKPLVEAAGPALASGSGALPPALAEYRWMVEEYRVSLFAQDLKTSVPVSALRLERLWARAQGEAMVARVLGS